MGCNRSRNLTISDSPAWRRVSDGLIAGICHEVNDRISSLGGAMHIVRLDGRLNQQLDQLMKSELSALEELSRLLRMLADDDNRGEEAIQLEEHLPLVARLHALHSHLGDVPLRLAATEEAPPVLVRWPCLCRALLVLVALAAGEVAHRPEGGVVLELGRAGPQAALRVKAEPGEATDAQDPSDPEASQAEWGTDPEEQDEAVEAVRAMATAAGGDLLWKAGQLDAGFELRLPALKDARDRWPAPPAP